MGAPSGKALSEGFAPSLFSLMSCLDGLVEVSYTKLEKANPRCAEQSQGHRDLGTGPAGAMGRVVLVCSGSILISETSGLPLALGSIGGPA